MFKRVLANLALIAFGGFLVSVSGATTLTIPNSFSPNTTIQSALMNGNFTTISSWANGNITDSNIGAGGIKASHIVCTTVADCTFGNTTAATIASGLTVGGDVSTNGSYILTTPGTICTTTVCISNDNGAGPGMTFNIPAGSLNQYRFGINGGSFVSLQILGSFTNFIPASATKPFNFSNAANTKSNMTLTDTGVLSVAPLNGGTQVLGQLPPVYTHTGTAANGGVGSGAHTVLDTLNMDLNGNCLNGALCTLDGNTVTFTNNSIFSGATNVSCSVTGQNLTSLGLTFNTEWSGTQLSVGLVNNTGVTINDETPEGVNYACTGI